MTIDERQVTTALRRYADDLMVTDEDVARLEEDFGQRRRHHRRFGERAVPDLRSWQWAVAACAVVALVLAVTALWRTGRPATLPAAPAPTTTLTPVSAADLVGAWMVDQDDSGGHIWYFTADGGRSTANTVDEFQALQSDLEPYTVGAGNVLTFEGCRAVVDVSAEGRMTITPLPDQDACPWPSGEAWPFVRLSPASPAGEALERHPAPKVTWTPEPVDDVGDLVGAWLLRGTGTMLVVERAGPGRGAYVLDDDGDGFASPDEQGTLSVGSGGSVTLDPAVAGDPGCRVTLEGLRTSGSQLQGTVPPAGCGVLDGSDGVWIWMN
ncbi:hypothetical protein [Oryzobacter terrae]|uniref:hypothetical protein n=1 Tax=Oryzobacter terrae TaxID=1620385 RepID=UPI00366F7A91